MDAIKIAVANPKSSNYTGFRSCMKLVNNGAIIIYEDCRNGKVERFGYIPSAIVKEIAARTLAGVEYRFASIRMEVDKRHVAFIHTNAERILAMPHKSNYLDDSQWEQYTG